jgi:hypothetical protein
MLMKRFRQSSQAPLSAPTIPPPEARQDLPALSGIAHKSFLKFLLGIWLARRPKDGHGWWKINAAIKMPMSGTAKGDIMRNI